MDMLIIIVFLCIGIITGLFLFHLVEACQEPKRKKESKQRSNPSNFKGIRYDPSSDRLLIVTSAPAAEAARAIDVLKEDGGFVVLPEGTSICVLRYE